MSGYGDGDCASRATIGSVANL